MECYICNRGSGTAKEQNSSTYYVVTIRELRHENGDKQSKLLADVDETPPSGAV